MQCSPSREASQTSAWAFPAPAQRQGMGHSPPGLPPGLPQGNAQAGGGFPYGHSPLGAAPVGLQVLLRLCLIWRIDDSCLEPCMDTQALQN